MRPTWLVCNSLDSFSSLCHFFTLYFPIQASNRTKNFYTTIDRSTTFVDAASIPLISIPITISLFPTILSVSAASGLSPPNIPKILKKVPKYTPNGSSPLYVSTALMSSSMVRSLSDLSYILIVKGCKLNGFTGKQKRKFFLSLYLILAFFIFWYRPMEEFSTAAYSIKTYEKIWCEKAELIRNVSKMYPNVEWLAWVDAGLLFLSLVSSTPSLFLVLSYNFPHLFYRIESLSWPSTTIRTLASSKLLRNLPSQRSLHADPL